MASERHVIVAGAGIAGLTAAVAMARVGSRVTVLEQARKLEETGAGIQLGPNASRVLIDLGLSERLAPVVMAPRAIRVMSGGSGREIVRIPLGRTVERRYGAPYWTIHRGDLQAALAAAAEADPDVTVKLGLHVEDFVNHVKGVTVLARSATHVIEERGVALIGADGVWSTIAARLRGYREPQFAHRTAWRALVPADRVPEEFRAPVVHLWLAHGDHLVHYPVKGGRLINIVSIVRDEWRESGWSAAGAREEILHKIARGSWSKRVRALIALPERWLKWALFHCQHPFSGGSGPVTLIGDAAHPMLPFLAQGAGMAIEDAALLGGMLGHYFDNPTDALRGYESRRRHRADRVQAMSRRQGRIYGMIGPEALARNIAMRVMGGEKLLARQDWLYSWQVPQTL